MAYDPSAYEAQRRALMNNYAYSGGQNVYQRFLDAQGAQRQYADLNTQFEQQAPQVVSGWGRRGHVGPNIKSGAFRKAMSDFAKNRAKTMAEAQRGLDQTTQGFDLEQRTRQDALQNDLRDLEMQKAREIDAAAQDLLRYRAGV